MSALVAGLDTEILSMPANLTDEENPVISTNISLVSIM